MDSDKKAARVERLKKMFAPGPEAIDYKHTPKCQKINFSSVSNPLCLNEPQHFNF